MFRKIFIISLLFIIPFALRSQSDEECLSCHNDDAITMTKNGHELSLTVKPYELPRSVHASLNCVDCHQGFDPYMIPHKENIEPINCTGCHDAPVDNHRFHPQIERASGLGGSPDVNCKGCHGDHNVQSPSSSNSELHFTNSTEFCGKCHASEKKKHLQSMHFVELSHDNPNAPTCIYCHQKPITPGNLVPDAKLKVNQERMCLDCHLDDPDNPSQYAKTLVEYENSVHGNAIMDGNANAAVCVDCHGAHKLQKASNPEAKIHRSNVHNLCGDCHTQITSEYTESVHGAALERGIKDVPTCTHCHGEHNIHAQPDVPHDVFSKNGMNFDKIVGSQMIWCVNCHSDDSLMAKYNLLTIKAGHDWLPVPEEHWKTVRCVDCHSSYEPPNLSHKILTKEKTIKKCEECHSQSSKLMSKLYIHEKEQSRNKYGFVNGTLLSDAYVVGTTRNVYLDTLSMILFSLTVVGIAGHGFLRWRSKKKKKKD